jgi:F-type H+-transporting ATPase subunit b
MFALLLQAAPGGEGQVSQIARTFGVDWPHLIAQIISFSIVCGLLYLFAYKNILGMLEERRKQIALGLANAEKIKAELARTEEQRLEVMKQAYAESARHIEEARAAAARLLEQGTQKSVAAAEQILAKAREAAEQDRERMFAELKSEVGRWVVRATAEVAGKVLTSEDQKRLAEEAARGAAA